MVQSWNRTTEVITYSEWRGRYNLYQTIFFIKSISSIGITNALLDWLKIECGVAGELRRRKVNAEGYGPFSGAQAEVAHRHGVQAYQAQVLASCNIHYSFINL